ncbi:phosphotransferase family protein [Cohnella luojiensis]|uniref:phosphotransferase family protein n=1 Tax=Cohnella luojiensis TaxID=652876 RepID=UPI0030B7FBFE
MEVQRWNKIVIHGDYNLGNILESDGKYTIIDWTNVQLGDPRYDIAWSIILIWIYVSEKYSSTYRSEFITMNNYTANELEKFEAIACLRWILLNRIANLPKRHNTISTVRTILMKNKYLNEGLL